MKFEMHGLLELMVQLERTSTGLEDGKKEALEAGGKVLQGEAKKTVRKRTGNLKEHIELSEVEDDDIFVYVDNQGKAYYGHMLEFGTSKMPAKPFMAPSLNKSKMKINQAMAEKLRNRLRGT